MRNARLGLIAVLFTFWMGGLPAARAARSSESREDLRRLATMPQLRFNAVVTLSAQDGLQWGDEMPDPQIIEKLQEERSDSRSEAERWYQLGQFLRQAGARDKASHCFSNSVVRYRTLVEQRPSDGKLLAQFGRALWDIGETVEAVSVLRRAVRLAPDEPEAYLALGAVLDGRSLEALLPGEGRDQMPSGLETISMLVTTHKPTLAQFEQAEQHWKEALRCFDRAVKLKPEQPGVWERRAGCRATGMRLQSIRKNAAAAEPNYAALRAALFSPDCCPDLRQAASLAPQDARLLGGLIIFEVTSELSQERSARQAPLPSNPETSLLPYLTPAALQSVQRSLKQLEALSQATGTGSRAAEAAEIQGLAWFMIRDLGQAEQKFRRAVSLDAKREKAWDGLLATLTVRKRHPELLEAARQRIAVAPTSRNHVGLAKAYAALDRWDEVANEARQSVEKAPDAWVPRVALVVALIRRDDRLATLAEALPHLQKAVELEPQADAQARLHLRLVAGIYMALTEKTEEAQRAFRVVLQADPNHEAARRALSIVEQW